jgi:hypothetical protein
MKQHGLAGHFIRLLATCKGDSRDTAHVINIRKLLTRALFV